MKSTGGGDLAALFSWGFPGQTLSLGPFWPVPQTPSLLALMPGGQSSGSQIGVEAGGLDLRYSVWTVINHLLPGVDFLTSVALCVTHSRPKPSLLRGGAGAPAAPEFQSLFLFVAHLYSERNTMLSAPQSFGNSALCRGWAHITPRCAFVVCGVFLN